jgi:SAM-dependent methyltransferase
MDLFDRYGTSDLDVLTDEESRRFIGGPGTDLQTDPSLSWQLLYRLEPELYDRLIQAERLHPAILAWLPERVDRIVEVGAGTGRLTLELIERAQEIVAVEPAAPMRRILSRRLALSPHGRRVSVVHGFFDALPVSANWAEMVVACSALTRDEGHGGEAGLIEMERVCQPGGRVVIIWPNNLDWLVERGYRYESFPGRMWMQFHSLAEAIELVEIFYPEVVAEVCRRGQTRVPYELLGVNPPRDLAVKVMPT